VLLPRNARFTITGAPNIRIHDIAADALLLALA
jgi:hypothetical protein